MQMIHKIADHYPVDGFTLTGGDPLFQFDACMKLIQKLKTISPDILIVRPTEKAPVVSLLKIRPIDQNRNPGQIFSYQLIKCISGIYQNIRILEEQLRAKYTNYLENGQNQIQNFTVGDTVVSVGIHKKGFSF